MQRIRHELLAVVFTTLYFAVCFGLLMTLKALILAEYDLPFHGAASALISALIVAKVVLILENISPRRDEHLNHEGFEEEHNLALFCSPQQQYPADVKVLSELFSHGCCERQRGITQPALRP